MNKQHYDLSKGDIISTISQLANAGEISTLFAFKPEMILKVIPPILVKTIIHFLKGEIHESFAAMDCFCQYYWLMIQLCEEYPEI